MCLGPGRNLQRQVEERNNICVNANIDVDGK
jgi:hypothetical protein